MEKKRVLDLNRTPLKSDDEQDEDLEKHCSVHLPVGKDDFRPNAKSAIDLNIASTETQDCPIAPTVDDEFGDGTKLNEKVINAPAQASQLKFAPNPTLTNDVKAKSEMGEGSNQMIGKVYIRAIRGNPSPIFNRRIGAVVPGPKLKGSSSSSSAPSDELQQPHAPPISHSKQQQRLETGANLGLQNLNSTRGYRNIMPNGRIEKPCLHSGEPNGCPYRPNCPYLHDHEVKSSRPAGKERKLSELMESTIDQKEKFNAESSEDQGDQVIGSKRSSMIDSDELGDQVTDEYYALVIEKLGV
ncbi:hypothetical protein CISIN_1g0129732mg, partial [Citrus sinensis]